MNKGDSWKRTEDIEIDLADLLRRLLGKWRQIAACGFLAALVLGSAGWIRAREEPDMPLPDIEKTAVLTEEEEQKVADAVRLENEIGDLEAYMENSLLMQIDPYHKARYIMLYRIDHAQMLKLPAIVESYLNFVCNGGAADALSESGRGWEMDKSCLAELIWAYQKTYSFPCQAVMNEEPGSMFFESLFCVEVIGRNAEEAKRMARDVQEILKDCSAEMKEKAGNHRITLINSAESMTVDHALQTQQSDKKSLLSSHRTNLKTMTDAFSEEQMIAFKKAAGTEDGMAEIGEDASALDAEGGSGGQGFRSVVKYIILGFVCGIFVFCGIFSCGYVFDDTVKSMEEMKRLYTFPVYGGISTEAGNKKNLPWARQDIYGHTLEQVQKRIRLMCQKQGIAQMCAVSDVPLGAAEKECLKNMAGQLKEWGIDLSVAENAGRDTSVWDGLAEAGSVFLVCVIGKTTHRMIDDAMMFYAENGVAVTGAVIFS